jgi:hypothetical protein
VPTRNGIDKLAFVGEVAGQFRCWQWKNVAFFCWFDGPSASGARVYSTLFANMAKSSTAKVSTVSVVAGRFSLPDAETRSEMAALASTHAGRIGCVSIIVPGTGFWVSAVRGFATGVLVLGPRTYDLHVDRTAEQVTEWFPKAHHKQTGTAVDPTELRDHINAVLACQTLQKSGAPLG